MRERLVKGKAEGRVLAAILQGRSQGVWQGAVSSGGDKQAHEVCLRRRAKGCWRGVIACQAVHGISCHDNSPAPGNSYPPQNQEPLLNPYPTWFARASNSP